MKKAGVGNPLAKTHRVFPGRTHDKPRRYSEGCLVFERPNFDDAFGPKSPNPDTARRSPFLNAGVNRISDGVDEKATDVSLPCDLSHPSRTDNAPLGSTNSEMATCCAVIDISLVHCHPENV